jgi:hypothetical protein
MKGVVSIPVLSRGMELFRVWMISSSGESRFLVMMMQGRGAMNSRSIASLLSAGERVLRNRISVSPRIWIRSLR